MSALSDLQKKLEQEAKGIMFPFSASASNISTTQNVYDSATDGIMTMQGQKYVGPDAVIQYGSEGEGFPRQLKQIEAPMLPQFDSTQFPQAGEGIMQTPTPAPTTPTTPVEPDAPAIDPCPPGFKFDPVKKVCVPIEQPQDKDDKDDVAGQVDFRRNIGPTAKGLGQAIKALNKLDFQKNPDNYNKDVNIRINNDIPLLSLIPIVGTPLRLYLKSQADKDLESLDIADGITVTKNADGSNQLNISDGVGKRRFGQLQTKESLAGNIASTQKKTAIGTIEKAPNGQNMIVGPLTLDYFGKGNLFQPTTRTPAETDALNQDEKTKLIDELNAALGITTPEPEEFGKLDTGEIITEELPPLLPEDDSGSSDPLSIQRVPKILKRLKDLKNGYLTETDSRREEQKRIEYETALDNANTVFESSVKQTSGSEFTPAQKQYIDSDDRKARAGETKNQDGSVDSRKGYVAGRENSGYGFRATSGNSKKQKDGTVTFDQRFK